MPSTQAGSSPIKTEAPSSPAGTCAPAWKSGPIIGVCWLLWAGLIVWIVIQAVHPLFDITEGRDQWGFLPVDVQWRLDRNNAMFVMGLLGALAAVSLAVGEVVIARRARKPVVVPLLLSLICGGLVGLLAGYVGHRAFELYRYNAEISDLGKGIRVYGAMFATLGGGIGLTAGLLLARSPRVVIHGLIGGIVAGVLACLAYLMVVAALMPETLTTVLIPLEVHERALWLSLICGSIGLIVPSLLKSAPQQGTTGQPPP